MDNKVLLKATNIEKTKEEIVTVGVITGIKTEDNIQMIRVFFKKRRGEITKKILRYNPHILGVVLSINDILLWTNKNIYLEFNGLLVPLRSPDRKTYKIAPESLEMIVKEQQDILSLLNEAILKR